MLHEQAAQRRADHRRHHPACGEGRKHLRPQVLGVAAADHHIQRNRDRACTQPLQQAPGNQHAHAHRETGQQQAQYEAGQAVPQRSRRSVAIGPAPGQGHADHTGGQGAAERQRIQAQAIERFGHGGHRGSHGQRLEGVQRDQRDHADGGGAVAGGQERSIGRHRGSGRGEHGSHTDGLRAALVNRRRR
ncbi:hypothetical protein G6F68_012027 [Rhizopus microsporus]|nr:hypothetical protein G6F68_012027 [Rhizopus microsporus]